MSVCPGGLVITFSRLAPAASRKLLLLIDPMSTVKINILKQTRHNVPLRSRPYFEQRLLTRSCSVPAGANRVLVVVGVYSLRFFQIASVNFNILWFFFNATYFGVVNKITVTFAVALGILNFVSESIIHFECIFWYVFGLYA